MSRIAKVVTTLMLSVMLVLGGTTQIAYGMRKVTISLSKYDYYNPMKKARRVKKGKTKVVLNKGAGTVYFKVPKTKKYTITLNNASMKKGICSIGTMFIKKGKQSIYFNESNRRYKLSRGWYLDGLFTLKNKKKAVGNWQSYGFECAYPNNTIKVTITLKKGEMLCIPIEETYRKPTGSGYESYAHTTNTKVSYTITIK